jgi:lambda family phage minor tail protein L
MSTQHIELAQHLATDTVVQLFSLDCSSIIANGAFLGVYNFTPGVLGQTMFSSTSGAPTPYLADTTLYYQGVAYTPFPIQVSGFERTTQGTQPRPKLSVSNIGGFMAGLVITGGDLLGARLTRIRTFLRFLDGQPQADPDAHWPPEIWIVDRKSGQNKTTIEWELATPLDNKNLKLPGRLALKNSCAQRYRIWNAALGAFDYSRATCPYTGGAMWTVQGQTTTDPTQDLCGKRLSDCRNRFGTGLNITLPFAGFPGMSPI